MSRAFGGTGLAALLGFWAMVLVLVFGVQQLMAYDGIFSDAEGTDPASAPPGPTLTTPTAIDPTVTPEPTAAAPTAPTSPSPLTDDDAPALTVLLDRVDVIASRPNIPGYDRGCGPGEGCVFGTEWNDATNAPDSRNGCDTRNDVLRRDLVDTVIDPDTNGCVVLTGMLLDPYTGVGIAFERGYDTSADVQIDHLIPLAAAWDLGAWRWSPAERAAFANDTDHELLAVDGSANLSKSDSTPGSWLPPNTAFRCEYAMRYLRAAIRWQLPITAADKEAIASILQRSC